MSDWIPVKRRVPEDNQRVLIFACDEVNIATFERKSLRDWEWNEDYFGQTMSSPWGKQQVTHWQPLPEPPKEAQQ